jgi:two-component system, NtrC family, sensor kinase
VLGSLTLRVVQPWIVDNKLIGFLELGKEIDHIAPLLKTILGVDLIFSTNKLHLSNLGFQGEVYNSFLEKHETLGSEIKIDSTFNVTPPWMDKFLKSINEHPSSASEVSIKNQFWAGYLHPLSGVSQIRLGNVYLLQNISQQKESLNRFFIILFLAGLVLAVSLSFFHRKHLSNAE